MSIGESHDVSNAAMEIEVAAFKVHRAVIEQAKGVLMQLLCIDEDRAFAILSRYSQHHNIRVHDLAARLIEAAAHDATPAKSDGEGSVSRLLAELAASDGPVVGERGCRST